MSENAIKFRENLFDFVIMIENDDWNKIFLDSGAILYYNIIKLLYL